ncbi:935_t:CDS:2, partial [Cetraspora pellucida]
SYCGIENIKYGRIKSNNDLRFEKDIEDELGFKRKKDTEDEPAIECKKNTKDGSSIELEDGPDTYHQFALRSTIEKTLELGKNSGKYVLCKTALPEKQRNKGSKRIDCPFLVNAYKSKGPDNKTIIKLISMHPEHNHQLISENASFATSYQKLITDMKELIESYTICDINVSSQVRLLHRLFLNATIVDYDVKNYVYKNPDWYVQSLINPETNKLQAVTNIYKLPLSIFAVQTIEATEVQPGAFMIDADPGLESVVPEIYPDIYLLYCEYWKQLMIDFPESTEYLLRQLDLRKTTWAKAFISRVFTAKIMSTQQSESINSIIKQTVNERTQLHVLFNQIESCVAEEQFA